MKIFISLLTISLLTSCFTMAASNDTPPVSVDPDKIAVTVNGTPIRDKQIMKEADKNINLQVAQMAAKGWAFDESSREQMRDNMRQDIVDTLIERQLIAERLKADKITITDAQIEARFLEIIQEAGKTAEEARKEAKEQGTTLENIKEQIWRDLAIEKLFTANAKDKKDVTETQAKTFYDQNPKTFEQSEEVQASHILIRTGENADAVAKAAARAKADEVLKKVKAGGDFAQLAREYSECASKRDGGNLGYFGPGRTAKPFEDVVFAMKKIGDVSDIVETKLGYHIIKLTGRKEARKKTFDEVKPQIMKDLRNQQINLFWEPFGKALWDNAKIEWSPQEKARRQQREKRDRENQLTEEEKAQKPQQP